MTYFRHACICTNKPKESVHFYEHLLEMRVVKHAHLCGKYLDKLLGIKEMDMDYIKLQPHGEFPDRAPLVEIHYWKKPKVKIPQGFSHIALTVDDIDLMYRNLVKNKVRFISPPLKAPDSPNRVCFCYDPDGNLVELCEEGQEA